MICHDTLTQLPLPTPESISNAGDYKTHQGPAHAGGMIFCHAIIHFENQHERKKESQAVPERKK